MNGDGWGFLGAGTSDNRLAGTDLQHNRQNRSTGKTNAPERVVTQPRESGGPMKHQGLKERLDESLGARHGAESHHHQSMASRRHESEGMTHHYAPHHGHHPMHHHLDEEKARHEQAMEHHKHHLERHHGRHYDSQYGHDHHKYSH